MSEAEKDTARAVKAAVAIFDNRDPEKEASNILVTLEGLITLVLLAVMKNDERNAAKMLDVGVVPGVERRLALAKSKAVGGHTEQ